MNTERAELAERFLERFPQFKGLFREVVASYTKLDLPETRPGESVVAAARQVVDAYHRTRDLETLAPYLQFLNSEYGGSTPINTTLKTAFINHLPDPQIDTELAVLLSPNVRTALDKKWDWRSDPDGRDFVNRILAAFPQFKPLAEDNTYGREKDVLPHPFMSQLSTTQVQKVIADKLEETTHLLTYFEKEYNKNEMVNFLIEDSFLGMFPYTYQPGYTIVELLGPKLEAAYRKQWNVADDVTLEPTDSPPPAH